ncbi:MAG: stress protein [Clostridiales bacterium]|nr:MAG: stress protein [Clostridiales bacterium]HJA32270.1 Dabb family protein [Candidatus Eisenbergiella pullicola]
MVNHIVLWSLKPELSEEEKQEAKAEIKRRLEGVKDRVEGVISLEVRAQGLPSSSRDLALISSFVSREALEGYQTHPAHLEAASYVRAKTCDRACFDYEG